jgi:hypothetical protein
LEGRGMSLERSQAVELCLQEKYQNAGPNDKIRVNFMLTIDFNQISGISII